MTKSDLNNSSSVSTDEKRKSEYARVESEQSKNEYTRVESTQLDDKNSYGRFEDSKKIHKYHR